MFQYVGDSRTDTDPNYSGVAEILRHCNTGPQKCGVNTIPQVGVLLYCKTQTRPT